MSFSVRLPSGEMVTVGGWIHLPMFNLAQNTDAARDEWVGHFRTFGTLSDREIAVRTGRSLWAVRRLLEDTLRRPGRARRIWRQLGDR